MVSLDPTVGGEIQGMPPVLVVSNNDFKRGGLTLMSHAALFCGNFPSRYENAHVTRRKLQIA